MDDLKALRDEIAAGDPEKYRYDQNYQLHQVWAARLTSIIERNEKERAFTEAAKAYAAKCTKRAKEPT